MSEHPVHWHEGQFLRPHHFQQSTRSLESLVHRTSLSASPFAYGVKTLSPNLEALGNWRVALSRCHLRLRDGSFLRCPEDCRLSEVPIERKAFDNPERRATIYVGVPSLDLGRPNASPQALNSPTRFIVDSQDIEDENMPSNPQQIQIRRPNARILIGKDSTAGFDAIPVMRLMLGVGDEGTPEIDPKFVPPILTVGASHSMMREYLQPIYNRLSEISHRLAEQVNRTGMIFETGRPEDVDKILKLQAVNSVVGGLAYLSTVGQVDPLTAYIELCRAAGTLSFFREERSVPDLPPYEHEELGAVFSELYDLLMVDLKVKRNYIPRPFRGEGFQMQVRLEREWLDPSWKFYIGVNSNMNLQEVDRLLRRQLDLKAGSADEVEAIYRRATAGVGLQPDPNPPRDFPVTDWSYWQVDRRSPAWSGVEKSLNFAIRFNERQSKGQIDGAEKVVVEKPDDSTLVGLSFTLYAMPS